MNSNGSVWVNGVLFHWAIVLQTKDYPGFLSSPVDVLRIFGEDPRFDIVLRLHRSHYHGGIERLYAFPILVLGSAFPDAPRAVPKGARIRIRPAISKVPQETVTDHAVRRIVEWCLSANFQAVRCGKMGSPQVTQQDDYSIGVPDSGTLRRAPIDDSPAQR